MYVCVCLYVPLNCTLPTAWDSCVGVGMGVRVWVCLGVWVGVRVCV